MTYFVSYIFQLIKLVIITWGMIKNLTKTEDRMAKIQKWAKFMKSL
jgi:hypothetical protein